MVQPEWKDQTTSPFGHVTGHVATEQLSKNVEKWSRRCLEKQQPTNESHKVEEEAYGVTISNRFSGIGGVDGTGRTGRADSRRLANGSDATPTLTHANQGN